MTSSARTHEALAARVVGLSRSSCETSRSHGAQVTAFRIDEVSSGTHARHRIHLDYDEARPDSALRGRISLGCGLRSLVSRRHREAPYRRLHGRGPDPGGRAHPERPARASRSGLACLSRRARLMWTPPRCHSEHLPDMQGEEISLCMIERMTTAIDDLDALDP